MLAQRGHPMHYPKRISTLAIRIAGAEPCAPELNPPCFDSFEKEPIWHNTNQPPLRARLRDGGS